MPEPDDNCINNISRKEENVVRSACKMAKWNEKELTFDTNGCMKTQHCTVMMFRASGWLNEMHQLNYLRLSRLFVNKSHLCILVIYKFSFTISSSFNGMLDSVFLFRLLLFISKRIIRCLVIFHQ